MSRVVFAARAVVATLALALVIMAGSGVAHAQVGGLAMVLTPAAPAASSVGTSHTVTAALNMDGLPLQGVPVDITVTGPNSIVGFCTSSDGPFTDADGHCTFTYVGLNAGTDTITATSPIEVALTAQATKTWVARLDSSTSTLSSPSGADVVAGASATDAATVSGSAGVPTGSVTFFLCDPATVTANGGDCSAGGAAVGAPKTLAGGAATSDATTTTSAPGKYCWRAEYSGSATYQPSSHADNSADCFTVAGTLRDTTPPTLGAVPADITIEASDPSGARVTYTLPTASDDTDPAPTVTCSPASGAAFALGTTTVSCTATDASNNTSTPAVFLVTVQDTTPPSLGRLPEDFTVEATGRDGATVSYTTPSASDDVDPNPTVTCNHVSGSSLGLGAITVWCTAADVSGNTTLAKGFRVTVQDTTAPMLGVLPGDVVVESTGPSGAAVSYASPAATDLVDPAAVVACAPASGSMFALGVTTVSCRASDAAGNTSEPQTFTVEVLDTTDPTIRASATTADGAVYSSGAWTNQPVTVHFSCADDSSGIPSGACPADRTVTSETGAAGVGVFGNVSDAAGNGPVASNVINVMLDATKPTLAFTGNVGTYTLDQTVTIGCSASDALSRVASDSCTTLASSAAYSLGAGSHSLTATATDRAGNTVTASTSFTVVVTPGGLAKLTTTFVAGSSKYRALTPTQQKTVDALADAAATAVAAIVPRLSPTQKAAFARTYDALLTRLATAGWLTKQEATTLAGLAAKL